VRSRAATCPWQEADTLVPYPDGPARRQLRAFAAAHLAQRQRATDVTALANLLDVWPCDDPRTLAASATDIERHAAGSAAVADWWCERAGSFGPFVEDVVEDEVAYGVRTFAEAPEQTLVLADGRRETYREAALTITNELRTGGCPARRGVQALMGFADGSIPL
jgi:hypothetical protein